MKLTGARVIGVCGGDAKCEYVCVTLGADGCVNYKSSDKRVEEQFDGKCSVVQSSAV